MQQTKISLKTFISREFYKAALLPLLIIELTLLALYFSMNSYIHGKSMTTLSTDRFSHLQGIVESQSTTIAKQLGTISDLSKILQSHTTSFFQHPERFATTDTGAQFKFAPNGVYHKLNDNGGSSLFYTDRTPIGPEEKGKARRTEALDPFFKNILNTNENIVAVYVNTHDSMCRYYPFHSSIHEQLPPKMNIPEYNFYYLADAAHNPERKPVWTQAYLDPMGKGWMMSCIVPIYRDDFLEGVAGIDITITNFIDTLMALNLPWGAQPFFVDKEGTIMAMPHEVAAIFALTELQEQQHKGHVQGDTHKPEQFNLLKSILAEVAAPLSSLMQQESGTIQFDLNNQPYVLSQATVAETGWKLMALTNRNTMLAPITRLQRHTKRVGYAAAGFMVLFYIIFFLYLFSNTRRMSGRIASTIENLTQAFKRLGTGSYTVQVTPSSVIEFDELAGNFQSMAGDLEKMHDNLNAEIRQANSAKDKAKLAEERLAEHQAHLERLVTSRTEQLTRTNALLEDDIRQRKEVEEELDLERQQLLSIFDSIDEPIYVATPDTHEILFVNEVMKKNFPEAIGQKCYVVLQKRTSPCPFCTNKYIFGENLGKTYLWEFYNEAHDRWLRCVDKAIQWPDGRMVRYEMGIDITDQKNAAEEKKNLMTQLQRAEKMEALGTLAGGVAHDLNNILGGLVGYPDLLLMELPEDSPLRKPILTIQESGRKAAAIVQDLLTLARRNVAVMEITQLNTTIQDYFNSPEHESLKQYHPDISFQIDQDDALLNCLASPVHISKMVMNLISNAAEALPQGGQVTISTSNQYLETPVKGYGEVNEGDYVVLTVADNGVGIPEGDLNRIFEPFFTKKQMGRSGTGLGMSVVWGTVKDHQGYIEVDSAVNSGTTFKISLPASQREHAAKEHNQSLDTIMGNNERILVVDDVEIQRDLAEIMLTKLGYAVTTVASGEEAIDYVKHNTTDLLILDMIMESDVDGLETYKRVLELSPGQKAIIASGFSETLAIKETQRLGAGKYIKKPYSISQLGSVVYNELRR